MQFVALATDYDGTLATEGKVCESTLKSLRELKSANKRLILITGRQMPDLSAVFPELPLFELVIAENGAVLYLPETQEQRLLGPRPPEELIRILRDRAVTPLSIGECIIATWTPHEQTVMGAVRKLNLDWQLIFNKGAVMCLPPGINKASGLAAALEFLNLSAHNVIGIGDAENDIAFLAACGCSVAVANALEPVKAVADLTTPQPRGAGVTSLIGHWLEDATRYFGALKRHALYLGDQSDGTRTELPASGGVLVTGTSGAGKSRLTRLLVERLADAHYQLCVIDPESDYSNLEHFSHLGDATRTPTAEEVIGVLSSVQVNVALNLLATDVPQRAVYFADLMGRLAGLQANSGRPHWLILDEAHHLCPRNIRLPGFPARLDSTILVSARPEALASEVLRAITTLVIVGENAPEVLGSFCSLTGMRPPTKLQSPKDDEVLLWGTHGRETAIVRVGRARQPHARHIRKYAEGRLGDDHSFYFRGPGRTLNLKAFNLATFIDLAQGVDDASWLFHLQRGDYSRWFREVIKDEGLARQAESFESSTDVVHSRDGIAAAIKRRYVIGA